MRKGIFLAGSAYIVWGLFPLYFKALQSVPSLEILIHRMLWSLLFLAGVLAWRQQWSWLSAVRRQPKVIAGFTLSALLLSSNWFIYIWAVNDGHVVDASLGYFITPLVNILIGSAVLRERLRPGQWLAVAFAALGVAWLTWQTGHLPWVALALAITFGTYGLLRKTSALGALEGLSLETILLFPFAFAYLAWLTLHGQNAFLDARQPHADIARAQRPDHGDTAVTVCRRCAPDSDDDTRSAAIHRAQRATLTRHLGVSRSV
jgi:chloramphenicol-sensitive protein RarD